MQFYSVAWALVLLSLAGCASQPNDHFTPGPLPQQPKPMTLQEQTGLPGATGVNAAFAQTFTASASGYLTEIDLGTQQQMSANQRQAPQPISLELRTLKDGVPDMSSKALKFSGTIPGAILPDAGSVEGGMVRIDVSRQRVHVNQGDQLAIVQSPSDKSWLQVQVVFGHPYEGGDWYQYDDGVWKAQSNQSQFRVYADPSGVGTDTAEKLEASTTSTSLPSDKTNFIPTSSVAHGELIAQCSPKTRQYVRQRVEPAMAGTWQFRTIIFQDQGCYYLQSMLFNGSNRVFGFGLSPSNGLVSVTLSSVGGLAGRVIFPSRPNGNVSGRFSQSQLPAPGEGSIRQFKLNEATDPLSPGTYIVSIVYGEQIVDHTVTTTFKVP